MPDALTLHGPKSRCCGAENLIIKSRKDAFVSQNRTSCVRLTASVVLYLSITILFGGCSNRARLGNSEEPFLRYASFSSKAPDAQQLIESTNLQVANASNVRAGLVESRGLLKDKSAEITALREQIDSHTASLSNTLRQLGVSFSQQPHHFSETDLQAAKQAARKLVSKYQAALVVCRNEASRITPIARLESERYVDNRYEQIDHGIAARNRTRAEIGARPAGQAEAQARARKQIQARAAGQQLYENKVSANTSANAQAQKSLRFMITAARNHIRVLDTIPRELRESHNQLADAQENVRQLHAKIESDENTLRKLELLAERKREQREEAAARQASSRLVSASTVSYPSTTSRRSTTRTGGSRQAATTTFQGSSGSVYRGKAKTRGATNAIGSSAGSSRTGTKSTRYYDPSYRPNVGVHVVEGYTRKDGTRVKGHVRTNQDRSFWNNMSSFGNKNPYTGRTGTKLPPAGASSGFFRASN